MEQVLSELIRRPEFGARVAVSGFSHYYERPCQGIQVTEQSDPSEWLRENEIVLTTGISLTTAEAHKDFVEKLVASGCLALGYSPVRTQETADPEPPAAVVEACKNRGLPLFVLPYKLPLSEVTTFVNRRLLERNFASLRSAIHLYRQLVTIVVSGGSLQDALDVVSADLSTRDTMVMDRDGRALAMQKQPGLLGDELIEEARERRKQSVQASAALNFSIGAQHGQLMPVSLDGDVQAFILSAGMATLTDHEVLLLEQLHAAVTLTMARDLNERRSQRDSMKRLLEAIDVGHMSLALVEERMRAAGVVRDSGNVLFRVSVARAESLDRVLQLIENELIEHGVTATIYGEAAYFFIPHENPEVGPGLLAVLNARGWRPTVISSLAHSGGDGIVSAFREVNTLAQQIGAKLGFYAVEDMDTLTVLRSNHDEMIRNLVKRILGPIIDHDQREGTDLLVTLEKYLQHGCRIGPAAAELFVHRHTITYRLKQIAVLSEIDPRVGESLLEYSVALRLYRAGVSP